MSGAVLPGPTPGEELLVTVRSAAEEIAARGGALLRQFYTGPLDVRYKSRKHDRDPVTDADELVEQMVHREVASRFPEHGLLGEEAGGSALDAEFLWVVDPLDGTANFANGLPIFACSVGVLRDRRPVAAALYTTFGPHGVPAILSAQRGSGLLLDGRPFERSERRVVKRARLAGVPAGFGRRFRHGTVLSRLPPGETRSLGSIAVELGLVATGALQYAVFGGPKIWDVAGGVLLVQEAGGLVIVRDGSGWPRLDRFEPQRGKTLAAWSLPLIAGDRNALREIAPRLGVRRNPRELAEAALGPERVTRAAKAASATARMAERVRGLARRGRSRYTGGQGTARR